LREEVECGRSWKIERQDSIIGSQLSASSGGMS
jgi:hypothetical protein